MLLGLKKIKILYTYSIYFFLFVIGCIHLLSLKFYSLPWFDEVFFSSISESFLKTGSLVPSSAATVMQKKEMLLYGPVYFMIQALSFKIFDFGVFQARIPNLIFGISLLYFWFQVVKNQSNIETKTLLLFIVLLFALDPFYNLCLHEGRMDLTAIFFFYVSFYLLSVSKQSVFSGLFLGLALLTTPRILVLVIPFVIYCIFESKKKEFFKLLTTTFLNGLIWIVWKWEILVSFVANMFVNADSTNSGRTISEFLFFNGYVPIHEKLLIVIVCILCCWAVYLKRQKPPKIVIWAIGTLVLHYVFVYDFGPYSIYILPSWYLILAYLITSIDVKYLKIKILFVLMLFIFNISMYVLKNEYVFSSLKSRNEEKALEFVKKYIPSHSKIIGDATYFYIAKLNQCEYEFIDHFGDLEQREKLQRIVYQYDYIIISDIEKERTHSIFNFYQSKNQLNKIAHFNFPDAKKLPLISNFDGKGYSSSIYKVMK